jgi:LPS sulfotransferase NodH
VSGSPRAYIICATPRTGSTLLCRLLKSAGAGDPDSFFGRRFIAEWAEHWSLPPAESMTARDFATAYLDAAIKAGRGGTDVFGLRLMRENVVDLDDFVELVHPGLPAGRARFARAFGPLLYIHLSRADKVAQAVSLVKAEQTGLWHIAPDGTELERLAPPQEPTYDFERLHREVSELQAFDAEWNAWFAEQGIARHRIAYEDLSADPAGELLRLCAALGITAPDVADVKPAVAKLADATSREWAERYRRDVASAV